LLLISYVTIQNSQAIMLLLITAYFMIKYCIFAVNMKRSILQKWENLHISLITRTLKSRLVNPIFHYMN